MYDTAIIGTGPAGVSAALTLQANNKSIIWLGSKNLSSKVSLAEQISNYPGFTRVSGSQLNQAFIDQVNAMGLEITELVATGIIPMGDHYAVTAASEFYEAKTVLFASGVETKSALPGETDYLGKGVSYCATCDGMLYRGKKIAVLCNTARFEHEVKYLAELASEVYYYPYYKDCDVSSIADNVQLLEQRPVEICGDKKANALKLKDGQLIEVDGIFCLRDAISVTTLLPAMEMENGHIIVNRRQETNLTGCYAAGDCTGRPYQYAKAVGEGNVAAHSIVEYLAQQNQ